MKTIETNQFRKLARHRGVHVDRPGFMPAEPESMPRQMFDDMTGDPVNKKKITLRWKKKDPSISGQNVYQTGREVPVIDDGMSDTML